MSRIFSLVSPAARGFWDWAAPALRDVCQALGRALGWLTERLRLPAVGRKVRRFWVRSGLERKRRALISQPLWTETADWLRQHARWYAGSTLVHICALFAVLLVMGTYQSAREVEAPRFEPAETDLVPDHRLPLIEMDEPVVLAQGELDSSSLLHPERASAPKPTGNAETVEHEGGGRPDGASSNGAGLGSLPFKGPAAGPRHRGSGGLDAGRGQGDQAGAGGPGSGFGGRFNRGEMARKYGGTRQTEIAVAAALDWFYRHRNTNGSWSLARFNAHCVGQQCSGPGSADSDVAATSLALLTFLAAGETHKGKGPYREVVNQGLYWLMNHRVASGDLSAGSHHQMYTHALAAITLCEAYGMTKDVKVGDAAQRAVIFIEQAQVLATGGWRYIPQDPTGGDTSVLGWQIMALHSAQLAGLSVNSQTLENAKKWLNACSKGSMHGMFSYLPYKDATPTMTAIGMLSWQYLGMRQDDPAMVEGKHYLLQNLPDNGMRNTYYWYYGAQVMHNLLGHDWDMWNRATRRALLESQCRSGCATGSWDPENPTVDAWSEQGGRIVTTAFSTLTLEIYYRYLPLYGSGGSPSDAMQPAGPDGVTATQGTSGEDTSTKPPF